MNNDFTSQNNDKVINIGTNEAPIYTFDEESAEKNQAYINNSGIHNSTVTNHIYQNIKPKGDKQNSNHLIWVAIAIFGMFGIVVVALSIQPSSITNTQSEGINLISTLQSDNANSIINTQPNLTPQNVNVAVSNLNQTASKSNQPKSSTSEKKQITAKTRLAVPPKKSEISSNTDNVNYWTSPCTSYVNGCPSNKEE